MVLTTPHGRIALSTRALREYRRLVDRTAIVGEIRDVMCAASLVMTAPGWLTMHNPAEAYLVAPGWSWSLMRSASPNADWTAVSFKKRRRPPKAEVRAWREQAREGWAA